MAGPSARQVIDIMNELKIPEKQALAEWYRRNGGKPAITPAITPAATPPAAPAPAPAAAPTAAPTVADSVKKALMPKPAAPAQPDQANLDAQSMLKSWGQGEVTGMNGAKPVTPAALELPTAPTATPTAAPTVADTVKQTLAPKAPVAPAPVAPVTPAAPVAKAPASQVINLGKDIGSKVPLKQSATGATTTTETPNTARMEANIGEQFSQKAEAETKEQEALQGLPGLVKGLQNKYGTDKAAQTAAYISQLDKNQKSDFWSKMIQALGQVTAGLAGQGALGEVTGIHRPIAVGANYKPSDMYDVKAQDKLAETKYGLQTSQLDTELKDAIAELQGTKAAEAKQAGILPMAASQKAEALSKMPLEKTTNVMTKSTGVKEGLVQPKGAATLPAGTGEIKESGKGISREDYAKNIDDIKKSWEEQNISGAYATSTDPKVGADEYADYVPPRHKEAMRSLYKFLAKERPELNPEQLSELANMELNEATSIPPVLYNKAGRDWYKRYVKLFQSNGIKFGNFPNQMLQTNVPGMGWKSANPYDPYDPNNKYFPGYEAPDDELQGSSRTQQAIDRLNAKKGN